MNWVIYVLYLCSFVDGRSQFVSYPTLELSSSATHLPRVVPASSVYDNCTLVDWVRVEKHSAWEKK